MSSSFMSALSVVAGNQLLVRHKHPEISAILSTAAPQTSFSDVDTLVVNLYSEVVDAGHHEVLQ